MQDDYNRFIKHSIKQAQCNYEDIFDENIQSENQDSFCCVNVQSAQSNKCGCNDVKPSWSDKCGCSNDKYEQIPHCECEQKCRPVNEVPVMVFIEMQKFGKMYNEAEGLKRGTIFPALDKPFMGGGCNC